MEIPKWVLEKMAREGMLNQGIEGIAQEQIDTQIPQNDPSLNLASPGYKEKRRSSGIYD